MKKILVIGPRKAGKSEVVNRLAGNAFDTEATYEASDRINTDAMDVTVDGAIQKINLYEVPNPAKITSKTTYVSGTDAILLVFNPNDRNGFDELNKIIDIKDLKNTPIILVSTHANSEKVSNAISDFEIANFMKDHSNRIFTHIKTDATIDDGMDNLIKAMPVLISKPENLRGLKVKVDEVDDITKTNSFDARFALIADYQAEELKKTKMPKEYKDSIKKFCAEATTILQDASKTREQKDQALENAMFDNLNKHRDSKFLKYISNFLTKIALKLGICKKSEEAYKAKYGTFFRTEAPTDRYVNATKKFGVSPRKFG